MKSAASWISLSSCSMLMPSRLDGEFTIFSIGKIHFMSRVSVLHVVLDVLVATVAAVAVAVAVVVCSDVVVDSVAVVAAAAAAAGVVVSPPLLCWLASVSPSSCSLDEGERSPPSTPLLLVPFGSILMFGSLFTLGILAATVLRALPLADLSEAMALVGLVDEMVVAAAAAAAAAVDETVLRLVDIFIAQLVCDGGDNRV